MQNLGKAARAKTGVPVTIGCRTNVAFTAAQGGEEGWRMDASKMPKEKLKTEQDS